MVIEFKIKDFKKFRQAIRIAEPMYSPSSNSILWYDEDKIFSIPTVDPIYNLFESIGYEENRNFKVSKQEDLEELANEMDIGNTYTIMRLNNNDCVLLLFKLYEIEFDDQKVHYIEADDPDAVSKNLQHLLHSYALTKVYTLTEERISSVNVRILKKIFKIPEFREVRPFIKNILSIVSAIVQNKDANFRFYT